MSNWDSTKTANEILDELQHTVTNLEQSLSNTGKSANEFIAEFELFLARLVDKSKEAYRVKLKEQFDEILEKHNVKPKQF